MSKKIIAIIGFLITGLIMVLVIGEPIKVMAQDETSTPTITLTPTITSIPPIAVTVKPTYVVEDDYCVTGTPSGWGTSTPSSLWWLHCLKCMAPTLDSLPTVEPSNTPTITSTVTGTIPPTNTPTITSTPSPTPWTPVVGTVSTWSAGSIGMSPSSYTLSSMGDHVEYTGSSSGMAWYLNEAGSATMQGGSMFTCPGCYYDIFIQYTVLASGRTPTVTIGGNNESYTKTEVWFVDVLGNELSYYSYMGSFSLNVTAANGNSGYVVIRSTYPDNIRSWDFNISASSGTGSAGASWSVTYNVWRGVTDHIVPTATPTPVSLCSSVQSDDQDEDIFGFTGIIYGNTSCFDIGPYDWSLLGLDIDVPWVIHLCTQEISFGFVALFGVKISIDLILIALTVVWALYWLLA